MKYKTVQDGSNEGLQHKFSLRNKEKYHQAILKHLIYLENWLIAPLGIGLHLHGVTANFCKGHNYLRTLFASRGDIYFPQG